MNQAVCFAQNGHWFLQMDIEKFFDTIDHQVLMVHLSRLFKEKEVLSLFSSIIETYCVTPGKGVPIGNLTSQFFGNHYLAIFDHFVKERLGVNKYLRYMDDFVFWSDNKEELIDVYAKVEEFLGTTLCLSLSSVKINRCEKGMTYLGYRVFPDGLRLSRRGKSRFRRKMKHCYKRLQEGKWSEEYFAHCVEALMAPVDRGGSVEFKKRVLQRIGHDPKARTA